MGLLPSSLAQARLKRVHTTKVMSPERSNLVLSSYVPNIELDVLVRDRLNVEAHGWNGSNILIQLQLV